MRRLLPLLLLLALTLPAFAQENYWIALNYRVTFYGNGTALVETKLHPFSLDGRSLFGREDVERDLNSSVEGMLSYTLLMFSDNPKLLRYSSVSYTKVADEVVLCDVANTGVLTKLRGAYILSALVYLNTSSYIRFLNGTLFEVKVRDSFTSMDVRSWIDLIEFRFEGARLVNYRWEPPFARGPRNESSSALLWVNFNEQEAPDFYVFTLEAPEFRYAGIPAEVDAKIRSVNCSSGRLRVLIESTGSKSGYAYVVAASGGLEQARKIYLRAGEAREVTFVGVSCDNGTVKLYSGSELLDQRKLLQEGSAVENAGFPLLVALFVAGALGVAIAAWLAIRRKRAETPAAPLGGDGPLPQGA